MATDPAADVFQQGRVTIVQCGRNYDTLDTERLEELSAIVTEAARTASPPFLLCDLSETTYFGSDFVSVLIRVSRILKAREGSKLAFCGLNSFSAAVFSTAKLDKIWEVHALRQDAVQALQAEFE